MYDSLRAGLRVLGECLTGENQTTTNKLCLGYYTKFNSSSATVSAHYNTSKNYHSRYCTKNLLQCMAILWQKHSRSYFTSHFMHITYLKTIKQLQLS